MKNLNFVLPPICYDCKHYSHEDINCAAFKNQIPEEILFGDNDHSKPLPEQDNDIVFEPIEKES